MKTTTERVSGADPAGRAAGAGAPQRPPAPATAEPRSLDSQLLLWLSSEQSRFGRELHDDVCARLAGIVFLAKALEKRIVASAPSLRDDARSIVDLTSQTNDRIRFLAHGLVPLCLEQTTLAQALTHLTAEVGQIYGIECECVVESTAGGLTGNVADQLFRITQEAINNAQRHGHARRVLVRVARRGGVIALSIQDDGEGFDGARRDPLKGIGLPTMRLRARSIGGRLRIASSCGGTLVAVRVPFEPIYPTTCEQG